MATPRKDNFLADIVKRPSKTFSYGDGFRLGVGFVVGSLAIWMVVGLIAWAIVLVFHLH